MPSPQQLKYERRLRAAESATVAARVGVVLLFVWGAVSAQRTLDEVERSQRVMDTIVSVRRHQLGTRLHNRGYMLTGDEREQRQLAASIVSRDSSMRALTVLTQANPIQRANAAQLATLLDSADFLFDDEQMLLPTERGDATGEVLNSPERVEVREAIVERIENMLRTEQETLFARTAEQHRATQLTLIASAIAVVLVALFGMMTLRARRRNADAIALSAATFRRLSDDSPDAVIVYIGDEVVYANAAMQAMLRADARPVMGRTVGALVHADDRDAFIGPAGTPGDRRTPTAPQLLQLLRDDGSTCEAEARAAAILFERQPATQVVLRDLTARREAERALIQSEQRFRAVLEAMGEGVVLLDANLTIQLSNAAAHRILGLSSDQLTGRSARRTAWRAMDTDGQVLSPERFPATVALRTGRAVSSVIAVDRPAIPRIWIQLTAVPLFREGAEAPVAVVATFADITARRTLEDELRQAQKMEVMGRMASGVAHDFNNLLTIIRSSAELLRLETRDAGLSFDSLSEIESATDRAAALTAHLLTFSRRQHAAPTLVQPAQLVEAALPILRRLAGDAVRVEHLTRDAADSAWIWADPVRFEQVLVNLVSNAKDAMPSGGTVRIRCELVALQESVTHRFGTIAAGRYVTLTIEDSGVGMTHEVLSHLFDPFYTTKPQGRGTGLGLSIVHGVVHEALGTITVNSHPGRGSRLAVYWPRAEATDGAVASAPSASGVGPASVAATPGSVQQPAPESALRIGASTIVPRASSEGGDRILLVDDEESVRRVLARQLQSSGYVVLTASSGREALAVLRDPNADVRAVVTDVRMPEMTGIELVETMLAEQLDRPVLLISGQLDAQLPRTWPDGAVVHFLAKPLSGVALRRAVGALIAEAPAVR
ncbi:MAG: ATP-binding protein [Gemmatimonadota bacterium]